MPYLLLDETISHIRFKIDFLLVKRGPLRFLLWLHQAVMNCVGGGGVALEYFPHKYRFLGCNVLFRGGYVIELCAPACVNDVFIYHL